jgi:acetyl esterase
MPLDPAAQLLLDLVRRSGAPPGHTLGHETLRTVTAAAAEATGYEGAPVGGVEHRVVAGVPVLAVTPAVGDVAPAAGGGRPLPVLVWLHGGGWVIGSAAEALPVARDLAAAAGCVVLDVDYRLAPEHRFPAALDDASAVTRWALEHADEVGGDPQRVAVGGDSAGGNLAAVVAQREDGLACQVLVYPVTDATWSQPSVAELADGYLLTADMLRWFAEQYLDGADPTDPAVSPLAADRRSLAGSCPALVLTAEYDPLRDEGEAYADRLREAGVPTVAHRYDGQLHGFLSAGPAMPAGRRAIEEIGRHLRDVLGAAR